MCAVVAESQEVLSSGTLVSFQQYADATVVTEADQEFHVFPIWPGQRALAVTFDAVFILLRAGEAGKVVKERETWSSVCHRYVVEMSEGAATDLALVALRAERLSIPDCAEWKKRLIQDYRVFSGKIKALFDQFDTEGTGSFTVNTFSSKMPEKILGSSELQHLYEDIDKERDFKIDLAELESWWRKGRKGESRALISAAVDKFLPSEISLRDFPFDAHYSEINIRTEDSLNRSAVIEVRGQNGICQELMPHIGKIWGGKTWGGIVNPGEERHSREEIGAAPGGLTWGVLVDPAQAAAAAETLGPLGLSESRSEQSFAFFGPLKSMEDYEWSYFHATLKTAASPEFINPSSFLKGLFQSFSFQCTASSASNSALSHEVRGLTRLHGNFSSNYSPHLCALSTALETLLLSPSLNSISPEICSLEGEKLRLFWLTEKSSLLLTVKMPFWQRLRK